MPILTTPSTSPVHPPCQAPGPRDWREIAFAVAATAAFSLLIAAVLSAFVMTGYSFTNHLIFSESIGMSIVTWAVVLARMPVPGGISEGAASTLRLMTAVVAGYLCGRVLACALVGVPITLFGPAPDKAVSLLATVIATGFLGYLSWIRQRLAGESAARAEAQRTAAEAELRLLRAQLEPHMLFNTLATLHTLIDEQPSLAREMVDRLITYLRWSLDASRCEWTTLGEEFAHLRGYLELMSLRMGPRLAVEVALADELAGVRIPPMLLQPLVENAIRHGLEPSVTGGVLALSARRDGDLVEVEISDSGLGLRTVTLDPRMHADADGPGQTGSGATAGRRTGAYGLEHVRQRLRATYGAQAMLTLAERSPHGVSVRVRIPA